MAVIIRPSVLGFFNRQVENGLFNTGTHLLKGLELASPFTWELAIRDRFGKGKGRFSRGRILCTVLMGSRGFSGTRSTSNEPASDGTVRISCANLNCEHVTIQFETRHDPRFGGTMQLKSMPKTSNAKPSTGRAAFCITDGINHATITLNAQQSRLSKSHKGVLDLIVQALTVDDDRFDAFCNACEKSTKKLTEGPSRRRGTPAFRNTVVGVLEQFGVPVDDYLVESYDIRGRTDQGGRIAREIHKYAIRGVHVNKEDASCRSLYIYSMRLIRELRRANAELGLSLTVMPDVEESQLVGFLLSSNEDVEEYGDDRVGHRQPKHE